VSRLFVAASSQRFEKNTAPLTAAPLTMAAWFRTVDVTPRQGILWLGDKDNANEYFALYIDGAGNDTVRFRTRTSGTGTREATTTGQYSANTWHHACGVEISSSSREVYIDGGGKGTNTFSNVPAGANRVSIGRFADSSPGNYFDGRLAEVGLWNVALSENEVVALSRGVLPWQIRPSALVGYWPVWGLHSPEIDLSNQNNSLTVGGTGTPARTDHAPVTTFTRKSASVPLIEVAAVSAIHLVMAPYRPK